MKELYTSMDSSRIGFYKSVLDEAGIVCFIQNEIGAQTLNVISPIFQPTLCIVDDSRFEEAVELLKPHHYPEETASSDWTCPKCGEDNPAGFEVCWNCAAEMTPQAVGSKA